MENETIDKSDYFKYDELFDLALRGRTSDSEFHTKILTQVRELYEKEPLSIVYPRNFWNAEKEELIFFLSDGYLRVSIEEGNALVHERNYCNLASKRLFDKTSYERQTLELRYDDGNTITLNSLRDSDNDWEEAYSDFIRELYKVID